jgi:AraC-like DNA-binding protein
MMDVQEKIIPFDLYPKGFIEVFTGLGIGLTELLDNTGIDISMLEMQRGRVSYSQQTQLIKNALHLCDKPGLGLWVGQQMSWSYMGTVGCVADCSPSLQMAGDAFRRYLPIAQPSYFSQSYRPTFYVDKAGVVVNILRCLLDYTGDPEIRLFELEFRLAATLRLYELCGNKSVEDTQVILNLDYPAPSHLELYQSLPCHHVNFKAKQSSIACHYRFVVEPWRELRRASFDRIIEYCEQELERSGLQTSFTDKVRWQISRNFIKMINLDEVSDALSISPRSLTRKLSAEDTNFRAVVHDVRMELAAFHLRSSHLSVEEVADIMGFSSASSLRRSIKNWSGETIKRLRHR